VKVEVTRENPSLIHIFRQIEDVQLWHGKPKTAISLTKRQFFLFRKPLKRFFCRGGGIGMGVNLPNCEKLTVNDLAVSGTIWTTPEQSPGEGLEWLAARLKRPLEGVWLVTVRMDSAACPKRKKSLHKVCTDSGAIMVCTKFAHPSFLHTICTRFSSQRFPQMHR
jgi:hypothetical protein